jgi:putative transposase
MAGIAHNQGFEAMIVGGARDHIHALIVLPHTLLLAKALQFLKGSSSKWMNETTGEFTWQESYGAFSVSSSQTSDVVRYIQNQRTHPERKNSWSF